MTVLSYFALRNRFILLEKPCKDHESRGFPHFRGCGKNFLYIHSVVFTVPFPYHLSEIVVFRACQEGMLYRLTPLAALIFVVSKSWYLHFVEKISEGRFVSPHLNDDRAEWFGNRGMEL